MCSVEVCEQGVRRDSELDSDYLVLVYVVKIKYKEKHGFSPK